MAARTTLLKNIRLMTENRIGLMLFNNNGNGKQTNLKLFIHYNLYPSTVIVF